MRRLLFCLAFFLPFCAAATDTLNVRLYQHALAAPATHDVRRLVAYLIKPAPTKQERAEVLFYWIAGHIAYDYDLASQEQINRQDITPDTVLRRQKTICSGYTHLFASMATYAGLESRIINGLAETYLGGGTHAWNAVRLDDKQWHLLDATWGSGTTLAGTRTFVQQVDLRYLFADPDFLLITHFPTESRWQLTTQPIHLGVFLGKLWKHKRATLYQDEAYLRHRTALLLK